MRHLLFAALILMLAWPASAQRRVPVTGVPGATLERIAGTPTLVTVKLRSGASDPNLQILEVHGDSFSFADADGQRFAYLFDEVAEVIVQGEEIEEPIIRLPNDRTLSAGERRMAEDALQRATEIFATATDNQELRISAATQMALFDNEDAVEYLRGWYETGDVALRTAVTRALYLAGEDIRPIYINEGLDSGNRTVRGRSALLAGLTGYQEAIPKLMTTMQDRVAEIATPAIYGLAYMGETDAIPQMMIMLQDLNQQRSAAAVFGLATLGDETTLESIALRADEFEGRVRLRHLEAMYLLGHPQAENLLIATIAEVPTLASEAGAILARDGKVVGADVLRQEITRLRQRTTAEPEAIIQRIRFAAELVQSGDTAARTILHEFLRAASADLPNSDIPRNLLADAVSEVCLQCILLGQRSLMPLLQPVSESPDPDLAILAVRATLALAYADYRDRLVPFIQARIDEDRL